MIVTAAASLAGPAAGELNMPVATRVLSFLQPPPTGQLPAAIIFEPGNAASEAEAAAIERAIGQGAGAGRASLRARRVPVGNLAALRGERVGFVTSGLRARHREIGAAAARASMLTISSDMSCVTAGHCVVGVDSSPRTQIVVSRAASRASNIRFGSAFLMLVREI